MAKKGSVVSVKLARRYGREPTGEEQ